MKWKSKILIGAMLLIAFCIIAPMVIHHQKKTALEAYQKELKDRGESIIPAEIAPHFNDTELATARRLQGAAVQLNYKNIPHVAKVVTPGHAMASWKEAILPDEDATNIWDGLRSEISVHATAFPMLREISRQPLGGVNLDYSLGPYLPLMHLAPTKGAATALASAMVLELHDGQPQEAWEDLMACVRISHACEREPLLISQLVHCAMITTAASATWEALQYPGWQDAQLAELQQAWISIEVTARLQPALAMERSMQTMSFDLGRQNYTNLSSLGFSTTPSQSSVGEFLVNPRLGISSLLDRFPRYWAWQSRWSYDEEVYSMKIIQAALESERQFQTNNAFLPTAAALDKTFTNINNSYAGMQDKFRLQTSYEWVNHSLHKFGIIEMQKRIVIAAIALQRFRLAHGSYPDNLTELVPGYLPSLPMDTMDGQPLRYKLKPDGTFLLYSVGDNGVDNGGDSTPTSDMTAWTSGRDAVWPMPATAVEISAYKEKVNRERETNKAAASHRLMRMRPPPPATN